MTDAVAAKLLADFCCLVPLLRISCGNRKHLPEGLHTSSFLPWTCSKFHTTGSLIFGFAVVFQRASWQAMRRAV